MRDSGDLRPPQYCAHLDRGVTENGWPYLVMDYVNGTPIHKYCIDKNLRPPEIVRLMLDCCRAVKYIHGNLVAHCDLKPTNILVDAGGSPRILDFGIARLIEPSRKTRTGRTTRGIRPLTLNYASPEQLTGAPLTESTDIYSLGVVLYEALTKTLPFDYSDYPWPQTGKKLDERDPLPPSKARLKAGTTREDSLFARQLRGDLDSIVLKTLARDPRQRYRSMDEFSDDLNRYSAGAAGQGPAFHLGRAGRQTPEAPPEGDGRDRGDLPGRGIWRRLGLMVQPKRAARGTEGHPSPLLILSSRGASGVGARAGRFRPSAYPAQIQASLKIPSPGSGPTWRMPF